MALPASELNDLKARCRKAQATGFGVGKADAYLADLAAELGLKSAGPATTENLLDLIQRVEDARAGKPAPKKAAPAPAKPPPAPVKPPEDEDEDDIEDDDEDDEDEDEDEGKSSPAASRPKPSGSKKKKPSKKR